MNEFASPPSAVSAAAPVAPPARLEFLDERRAFFGLLVRGALLQLVTFGFYRFWLITDIRRHLWTHTRIQRDSFEYTGRAVELLIGFLIAMAILAPIYIAYFLIGVEAELMQAFASVPLVLLLYLFGHFAIYRARRYRLTRTIWRGVRFWMDGSGWVYALKVFLWSPVVALTLGLAYPWRAASLERYKMRHTHYGDLAGDFVGRGGDLLKRIWWLILIAYGGLLAIGAAAIFAVVAESSGAPGAEAALAAAGGVAFLSFLAAPFLLPIYRAIEWRWWAEGARLGGVSLSCDLGKGALLKLYLKAVFVSLGAALALLAVIGVLVFALSPLLGRLDLQTLAAGRLDATRIAVMAVAVLVYLAFALTVNAVMQLYLQHDYWRVVATSLSAQGLDGVVASQRGGASDALGEGLADGLDVAGF